MRGIAALLTLVAMTACSNGADRRPDPAPTGVARPIGGTLLFVTRDAVGLVLPDGSIKSITDGQYAHGCAWSEDGRYAAWSAASGDGSKALYVHDVTTGRTGSSSGFRADDDHIEGIAGGFVAVYRASGKAPELVVADPARVLAGGRLRVVRLPMRMGTLLTAEGRRVLVQQPERGAAFTGGPSTVYEVTLDGRVTPLVRNRRDMSIRRADLTADGRRLVHAAAERLSQDRTREWVVVRDLAGGRELDVAAPSLPGATSTPLSIVTGSDGRTVATLGFYGPEGQDLAGEAYVLDGDAWRKLADGVSWAATGPSGALAAIGTGDTARLTVDGRHLADHAECAAWAP